MVGRRVDELAHLQVIGGLEDQAHLPLPGIGGHVLQCIHRNGCAIRHIASRDRRMDRNGNRYAGCAQFCCEVDR